MMTARNSALHYRDVLRPKARRRVALAQTYYGGMQLGVYDLLPIKQEQVMTEKRILKRCGTTG